MNTIPTAAAADLQKRVIDVIAEQTGIDPATIGRESRLFELGDSLDRVEVMMELEDEFELAIPDGEADELKTVGDLIDYIEARTARRKPTDASASTDDRPIPPAPGA